MLITFCQVTNSSATDKINLTDTYLEQQWKEKRYSHLIEWSDDHRSLTYQQAMAQSAKDRREL